MATKKLKQAAAAPGKRRTPVVQLPPAYPFDLSALLNDLPATPLAAALVAGQLFNRHLFEVQQDYFFPGSPTKMTKRLAEALPGVARVLVPADRRYGREKILRRQFQALHGYFDREEHAEMLASERARVALALANPGLEPLHLPELREAMVRDLFHFHDKVRSELVEGLEAELMIAFRLGEVIDEGVCPRNIYLYLDESPPPAMTSPPPTVGGGFGGTRVPIEEPPVQLAARRCRPGDISPEPAWWANVTAIWGETQLPRPVPLPPETARENLSQEQLCHVVGDLACRALEGLTNQIRSRMPPREVRDRLKILDASTKKAMLDGKVHRIPNPKAFLLVRHLIDANGKLVSKAECMKVLNMGEKEWEGINHFLDKNLPPEVRAVVRGVTQGGYQILFAE